MIDPDALLADVIGRLAPDGLLLVSVPNFAHWYPRVRVALGRFDYDRRGILDRGHVRFFTRRSVERMLRRHGLVIRERRAVGSRSASSLGAPAGRIGGRPPGSRPRSAPRSRPSSDAPRRAGPRCSATSSSISCTTRPADAAHVDSVSIVEPDPAGDHWRRRRAPAGRAGTADETPRSASRSSGPSSRRRSTPHPTRRLPPDDAAGGDRRPSSIRPRVRRRRHARHARLRRRPRRRAVRSVPHGGRQPGCSRTSTTCRPARCSTATSTSRSDRCPSRDFGSAAANTCTSLRGPRSCGCRSSS